MNSQQCPVCFAAVTPNPRYRRNLCAACAGRAVSADGRGLYFYNEGIWGGFIARHADDDSPHEGHTCYVDGLKCHADEARFGGIVIETAPMEAVLDVGDIEALLGCAGAEPSDALLSVFTPQVGLRFRPERRLLIVGRASNGWGILEDGEGELRTQFPASYAETPERRHDWARRTIAHVDSDPLAWADVHARRSAFVRVARGIALGLDAFGGSNDTHACQRPGSGARRTDEGVALTYVEEGRRSSRAWAPARGCWDFRRGHLGAPVAGWHQHVAWTELYKLGYAVEANPSEELMDAQLAVGRELLRKELRVLNPMAVVFLVGCSPSGDWFQWFDEEIGFQESQRLDVGRDLVRLGMIGETKAVVLPHPQGRAETPLVDIALAHLR